MESDGPMRGVLGIPMSRHGSGTSWLPDDTPTNAVHWMAGKFALMLHANVFVGYAYQGSDAGDDQLISQNWLMLMGAHPVGAGALQLRAMFSLEPFTVGESGYPLLLQTGETFEGRPLVDRQHPHDLFMELAATFDYPVADGLAVQLYGGVAGEPALGPTAFPHRPSAMLDPFAPLSHHWFDATHITFGVLTAGLYSRWLKLEGSWFNGREPDEDRLDLDLRGLDSFSARISVNPAAAWSLQASYGFLDSPESLHPDVSVRRLTASASHTTTLGRGRRLTSTAAFNHDDPSEGGVTHAVLLESALDLGGLGVTFLRAEYVLKSGEDFELPEAMSEARLPVGAFALGHVHAFHGIPYFTPALGVRGAVNIVGDELEARYGTRFPLGFMVYLQLQPASNAREGAPMHR